MVKNPVPMTVLAEYGLESIGVIVVLVGLYLSHLGKKQAEKDDFSSYGQWQ